MLPAQSQAPPPLSALHTLWMLSWTSAGLDCVRLWPLSDPHPARIQVEKQVPRQRYRSDSKVAHSKPLLTPFS